MRFLSPILLLLLFGEAANAQSRVITTSGNVYSGSVQEETANSVTIMTTDSVAIVLTRDKIASIEYDRTKDIPPADTTQPATAGQSYSYGFGYTPLANLGPDTVETFSDFYIEAGLAAGAPGGVNIQGALNAERWLLKANAGTVLWMTGSQAGIFRKLVWAESFELNLGMSGGMFFIVENERRVDSWLYLGPTLEMKLGGFFIEGALTTGFGDYDTPMPIGQAGFRFRIFDLGSL